METYAVVIVRQCGPEVSGVYTTHRLAENEVFRLVAEKNKKDSELDFDFAHVVRRPL